MFRVKKLVFSLTFIFIVFALIISSNIYAQYWTEMPPYNVLWPIMPPIEPPIILPPRIPIPIIPFVPSLFETQIQTLPTLNDDIQIISETQIISYGLKPIAINTK